MMNLSYFRIWLTTTSSNSLSLIGKILSSKKSRMLNVLLLRCRNSGECQIRFPLMI
ncbi:hypothetical protein YC2023_060506 [Brassica napus]